MLTKKNKLNMMISNLSVMESLADELLEKIKFASKPAPVNYDDEKKCNYILGGFDGIQDLINSLDGLAKTIETIHHLNR